MPLRTGHIVEKPFNRVRKEDDMKRFVSKKLVWLFLAVALTWTMAPVANAQPGEFVKGVLQPLADGFPKRAINIIVVDDPGSGDDIYAKSIQAALQGISPVPILVSCEPAPLGGSWYTISKGVPAREGGNDGYYPIVTAGVGMVSDLLIDPGTRDIGAKLSDLNMVISSDILPYILVQRKNAPWGPTVADMLKYAKANPGKLRYISKEIGSGADIYFEWILDTLGLKVEKIPQGSFQEQVSIVGAGEGDIALTGTEAAFVKAQTGRVEPTMIAGAIVPDVFKKNFPKAISAKEAGIDPTITGGPTGLGVPSKVPQAHVDWMYKLFKVAVTSDLHKKRAITTPGLFFDVVDGATMNATHKRMLEYVDPIIHRIGLHIDDVKKK